MTAREKATEEYKNLSQNDWELHYSIWAKNNQEAIIDSLTKPKALTMETKLIYSKILSIMKEVEAIGKTRKNVSQGYQFRGIDEVMNELHEKFSMHGVFILTDIVDQRHEERATKSGGLSIYRINTYKFTFMAEDGSFVTSTQIGEGMDSGDKASNKAAAVALKYALMFMFLIPTDEPKDPENDSHDLKAEKPIAETSQPVQQATKPAKQESSAQVELKPGTKLWGTVIKWVKDEGITEDQWPEIKSKNYKMTDEDESAFKKESGFLPF